MFFWEDFSHRTRLYVWVSKHLSIPLLFTYFFISYFLLYIFLPVLFSQGKYRSALLFQIWCRRRCHLTFFSSSSFILKRSCSRSCLCYFTYWLAGNLSADLFFDLLTVWLDRKCFYPLMRVWSRFDGMLVFSSLMILSKIFAFFF